MRLLFSAISIILMAATAATAGTTGGSIAIDSLHTGVVGNRFHISMTVRLDSVNIESNRRIIYTPLLIGNTPADTAVFPGIMVNGRRQHIAHSRDRHKFDGMEIRRHNATAQSVAYTASVPYTPWMDHATLYMTDNLCGCGRVTDRGRSEIAIVDMRPVPAPEPAALTCFITPEAEAVKARSEKGRAFIDFPVNRTEIHPDYRRNRSELDKITAAIDLVRNDPNVTITGIGIHGYASPEGPYANNARLAEGRAKALVDYVRRLHNLTGVAMDVASTPEDWEGLREFVEQSGLENRDGILDIISSGIDPDAKDARIRRLYPAQYAFLLKEVYPALRHSDYEVSYTVRPFSVEEAREIMRSNPRQLSLHELYMVARSYPAGSPEFNEVFEVAVRMYPDDPVANLNAAITAVNRGDTQAARRYVAKAADTPQAAEVRQAIELRESMQGAPATTVE